MVGATVGAWVATAVGWTGAGVGVDAGAQATRINTAAMSRPNNRNDRAFIVF
jgi:hypothetical protein